MTTRAAAIRSALLAIVVAACAPGPSAVPPATSSPPAPAATARVPSQAPGRTPAASAEPTPGSAIVPGTVDRSSLALTATYDVDLGIVVGSGALDVTTVIEVRNDSGAGIDRLELNTIAARLGGLTITGATVDELPVSVAIDDQTLLVPLGGILGDGSSATIRLGYTATLTSDLGDSDWLFTRAGGTLALYRWIPWVSRAIPFERSNHGDPFVTPSSPRATIRVATDIPMVLASPGALPDRDGLGWSFEVRDVRDVAIVLAPDFEISTGDAGGTPIRAYVRPGGLDGTRLVTQSAHALTWMAERLGVDYPWPALTVVETEGGFGMELPGLIWIPSTTAPADLAYIVHHETAHQWFYGIVGNDQQAEPFADEAAADLLARTVLGLHRASGCDPAPLDRSIERYSATCYFEIVYIQGGNLLDDVRESMGTEQFWATMGGYVESNRFGMAGTRQLLDALRDASPVDLLPTLRARFPSLY